MSNSVRTATSELVSATVTVGRDAELRSLIRSCSDEFERRKMVSEKVRKSLLAGVKSTEKPRSSGTVVSAVKSDTPTAASAVTATIGFELVSVSNRDVITMKVSDDWVARPDIAFRALRSECVISNWRERLGEGGREGREVVGEREKEAPPATVLLCRESWEGSREEGMAGSERKRLSHPESMSREEEEREGGVVSAVKVPVSCRALYGGIAITERPSISRPRDDVVLMYVLLALVARLRLNCSAKRSSWETKMVTRSESPPSATV